jgi:hypothetical protein
LVLRVVPGAVLVVLCSSLFAATAFAQPKAAPLQEKAPAELAPAIVSALQPAAVKVIVGAATLEIWWAQGVATSGEGAGWSNVESGTLVGAVRVSGAFKEIRGKVVPPGVYTLRYGQQPQNGDHLGISPFREFLLISPAGVDTDPKVLGFDGVVALSKQVIGTAHPASLSIDPPEDAPGAALSAYKNDSGHDGVVFEVKQAGGKAIKFGLIVSGLIVH